MKKILLFLLLATIIVLSGCKKPDTEPSCKITSPKDGAELPINEDIIVTVKVENLKDVAVVYVDFDNLPIGGAVAEPYTVTIPSLFLSPGNHTIKAKAVNNIGKQVETSITVKIGDGGTNGDESPDFVTFTNGIIPYSWKTNSWAVDIALGYDDNYSLRSEKPLSTVLTNKTMTSPGYIEFYARGDYFDLYIDNAKAEALSSVTAQNDWKKWIYAFNAGKHSFRWENAYAATIYLDAIKFAAATLPKVSTNAEVTNITATTAISGGNVTANGNHPVIARGVCWSTAQNPTIEDNKTTNGSGTGNFKSYLEELTPNTLYYVRAYATNAVGTAYGEQVTFSTLPLSLPTVTTRNITNIKGTSADCGGTVTSDGFTPVTARGICWSISENPTINDKKTTDGTGTGSFYSYISELTPKTVYYVRAYATNSEGTAYGEQRTFTPKFKIGQEYLGGKIAYIDDTGLHGFIADETDAWYYVSQYLKPYLFQWDYYSYILTGASETAIGTGKSNTTKIVQALGQNKDYAAHVCDKSGWYLPSKDELNELYKNRNLIGSFSTYYDDYPDYWSSSETDKTDAWCQNFSNGDQGGGCYKYNRYYRVRCIRDF